MELIACVFSFYKVSLGGICGWITIRFWPKVWGCHLDIRKNFCWSLYNWIFLKLQQIFNPFRLNLMLFLINFQIGFYLVSIRSQTVIVIMIRRPTRATEDDYLFPKWHCHRDITFFALFFCFINLTKKLKIKWIIMGWGWQSWDLIALK